MTLVGRGYFVTVVTNCHLPTGLIAIHVQLGYCQPYWRTPLL